MFIQFFPPLVLADETGTANQSTTEVQVPSETVQTQDTNQELSEDATTNQPSKQEDEEDTQENTTEAEPKQDQQPSEQTIIEESSSEEPSIETSESHIKTAERKEQAAKALSVTLEGMAIANPTNVYSAKSTSANVLKSYKPGLTLKLEDQNSEYYTVAVYINGKKQTGYILKTDVDVHANKERLQGFAGKQPVQIFENPDSDSNILKSYPYGQLLKYETYTEDWYVATIVVNGKKETGYIKTTDVGNQVPSASGVSLGKVSIYRTASLKSNVLKSYNVGKILKYKPYNKDWYQATVYINGKGQTGYIYKKHVDTIISNPTNETGIALQIPTKIYTAPTTSAKVLKSYKQSQTLKFKTFSSNWYQATVIINGIKKVGYIHKPDVGDKSRKLSGYALNSPTTIYTSPIKNTNKLKSYQKGTYLSYKYYNSDWFVATVIVNGTKKTGYINKNDVGAAPTINGQAAITPTKVYSETSTNSKVLKSYKKGSKLKYKPYDRDWYKVTVIINRKSFTGYIQAKDIRQNVPPTGNTSIVNPNQVYSYNEMVRDIKNLQQAYPELITYKVVGKSEYGRDIYAVSLGHGKAKTFINGSHHAREWLTTNLNMYMIEEYAKAYVKNGRISGYDVKSILNSTTIWFIPMVNPDGVTLQQEGLKAFPKSVHNELINMNNGSTNFKRWKANAKGVDLNRQYAAGWATIKNNPGKPHYQNFKGYTPESAAETKTIIKFIREINPEMSVAYHSSGQIIFWNYLQTGARYDRDHIYAKKISSMTGYKLVYPVGTPSGGGFTDWFISSQKKPAFTIEIAPYSGQTNPPVSEFKNVWNQNKGIGLYVAQESAKLYKK